MLAALILVLHLKSIAILRYFTRYYGITVYQTPRESSQVILEQFDFVRKHQVQSTCVEFIIILHMSINLTMGYKRALWTSKAHKASALKPTNFWGACTFEDPP